MISRAARQGKVFLQYFLPIGAYQVGRSWFNIVQFILFPFIYFVEINVNTLNFTTCLRYIYILENKLLIQNCHQFTMDVFDFLLVNITLFSSSFFLNKLVVTCFLWDLVVVRNVVFKLMCLQRSGRALFPRNCKSPGNQRDSAIEQIGKLFL